MAQVVYVLCALTSVACAVLLFRGWRAARSSLLFWSGLCFAGLALNNVLLFLDLVVFPTSIDLSTVRNATAVVSLAVLLHGLVAETR
jgi:hypothetical protein